MPPRSPTTRAGSAFLDAVTLAFTASDVSPLVNPSFETPVYATGDYGSPTGSGVG